MTKLYTHGDNFRSDPPSILLIINEMQIDLQQREEVAQKKREIITALGRRMLQTSSILNLLEKAYQRHKANATKRNRWFLFGMAKALQKCIDSDAAEWNISQPQFNLLCALAGLSTRQADCIK